MIRRASDRSGVTTGDVLLAISVLLLFLALAYPALRARGVRAEVTAAQEDLEALRRAAERHLRESGNWPPAGTPGAIPIELIGAFPDDSDLRRGAYTLQWARFDVVDYVEVPAEPSVEPMPVDLITEPIPPTLAAVAREIGGIVLFTNDDTLLAELLESYGSQASFVRDTSWTLLLPARGAGS